MQPKVSIQPPPDAFSLFPRKDSAYFDIYKETSQSNVCVSTVDVGKPNQRPVMNLMQFEFESIEPLQDFWTEFSSPLASPQKARQDIKSVLSQNVIDLETRSRLMLSDEKTGIVSAAIEHTHQIVCTVKATSQTTYQITLRCTGTFMHAELTTACSSEFTLQADHACDPLGPDDAPSLPITFTI